MKKHPVFLCMLFCTTLLVGGISLAYYNTRTFGFDENASVITVYDDSVKIMDVSIEYEKVRKIYKKLENSFPKDSIVIRVGLTQQVVHNLPVADI